jgi:hypothetical protein
MQCAERGDFFTASSIGSFAWIFAKENPNALALKAELYVAWQDLIAARYAKKVVEFEQPQLQGLAGKVFATPQVREGLRELKERMMCIIRECEAHPEWRDSYPLKEASGCIEDLL